MVACFFWGEGVWMDGGVYVYVCAAIHDLNGCGGVYMYVLVGVWVGAVGGNFHAHM